VTDPARSTTRAFRASGFEFAEWDRCAKRAGLSRNAWARESLNREAETDAPGRIGQRVSERAALLAVIRGEPNREAA
jgi:hypothetical protein